MGGYLWRQAIITAQYWFSVRRQRQRVGRYLLPLVTKWEQHRGPLPATLRHRILFYYPMGVTVMAAENFALLRGNHLSPDEHETLLLLAALGAVYDDLTDTTDWNLDDWKTFIYRKGMPPVGQQQRNLFDLLTLLRDRLMPRLPDGARFDALLEDVVAGQLESRRQLDPSLSYEACLQIMYHKGGASTRMIRAMMQGEPAEAEMRAAELNGILLQLSNDAFDVYKDTQASIRTPVTAAANIQTIRHEFLKLCNEMNRIIPGTPGSAAQQRKFRQRMAAINGRTAVALHQWEQLEQTTGTPIPWHERPRHELIVDMERWHNVRAWWREADRFGRGD